MSLECDLLCGIDVGGTFTDLVLIDVRSGQVETEKLPTTPDDPSIAIVRGLEALRQKLGGGQKPVRIIHATTLVTNALIERRGAKLALLATEGFADIMEFRRENRFDIFDLAIKFPQSLVDPSLRWQIPERMGPGGEEIKKVDTDAVARAAVAMRDQGVEAVVIAFLHAYESPEHEQQAADALRSAWPCPYVTLSGVVAPLIREYERTCTAVVNSYVMPLVDRYLDRLTDRASGIWPDLSLGMMVSNGGICSPQTARQFPVRLLESGPVAGALVAAHFAKIAGISDLLAFDMGGTTAKLCVIRNSAPTIVAQFEADRTSRFRRGSGIPILVPSVDLVEIGAGGGSIAWIDELGLLQVGPRSASAVPGPACYGKGGTEATVTDADLILGYLSPEFFLGGKMPLDPAASQRALDRHVGAPLGLSVEQAAWGIHDLVNENMANAAWLHMAEKGLDPRTFALVATGGAGPVHACHLAQKVGISKVIFPPASGVASAFGLLVAPPRADISHSFMSALSELDINRLNQLLAQLEISAAEVLRDAGVPVAQIRFERVAEMLYEGQTHQIEVPLPLGDLPAGHATVLTNLFHDAYFAVYEGNLPGMSVEMVGVRVTALADAVSLADGILAQSETGAGNMRQRSVYVASERRSIVVPVIQREDVGAKATDGPAIVESPYTTIVVDAGWTFRSDAVGSLHLDHVATAPTEAAK